jgi:glycosyltransferase involved in cell wall biosynthesis
MATSSKGNKSLNIVLYVNNFLPKIGGKEIVVYNLASEYKKLGHKVRVVGPSGLYSHRKCKYKFPVHRCPIINKKFHEQINLYYLLLNLWIFGCDIVHAHTTNPNGYIAAKLKRKINFPLIITPHGSDIHTIPGIEYGQMLDKLNRKKIAYAIKKADILTAISNGVRDSLIAAGASIDKVRMIPNGVDINRFSSILKQNEKSLCRETNKSENILLSVGNYRECKGYEDIVRAMPTILKEEPHTKCVFVGKGNEALLPVISDMGLEKEVILKGPIKYTFTPRKSIESDRDKLAEIFNASTIYISAGIDEGAEGMSLALLEAMASGLPVVATAISGNRDVVENGVNGLLAKPSSPNDLADKIIHLLKNETKRDRIAIAQREKAKQYGWANIAGQYIEVYKEAIVGIA